MAEIFLGKLIGEDGFERVCCFKRILPHFAAEKEFIEMFRDEAHIGKRLQHANIVRVEGFEEVDGAYAIIMEFVAGADLRSILAACETKTTRLPIPMAVHIIAEAARGLHYAHTKKDEVTNKQLGIVHRDISPQNILISFDGEVKVTDFGIADANSKITDTKTGIVKGKFAYMSPEQISAQPVDPRTDIFALSIILWEVITMRRLFQAENEVLTIQLVRDCLIPEDTKAYNEELDDDLDRILRKGLAKDLKNRYETAALFEKELRLYQSKHYPDFSSEDLGQFLQTLMNERKETLAEDIKELLLQKELSDGKAAVEIDLRAAPRRPTTPVSIDRTNTKRSPLLGSGTQTSFRSPGSARLGYPEQTRLSRPMGSQRKHVPVVRDQSDGTAFWKFLAVVLLLAGAAGSYYYYYTHRKAATIALVSWTVHTVPDSVRLQLDGQGLFGDHFIKTPIELKSLSPGNHTLIAIRPGFESEATTITLTPDMDNSESNIILKQIDRMAPLRLSLKSAVPPVRISMDDGLVDESLNFEQPLNLNSITFGKEHLLIVTLSEDSSFSCQFTPRAQTWETPFLVVVDSDMKKCSYPLR